MTFITCNINFGCSRLAQFLFLLWRGTVTLLWRSHSVRWHVNLMLARVWLCFLIKTRLRKRLISAILTPCCCFHVCISLLLLFLCRNVFIRFCHKFTRKSSKSHAHVSEGITLVRKWNVVKLLLCIQVYAFEVLCLCSVDLGYYFLGLMILFLRRRRTEKNSQNVHGKPDTY